MGLNTLAVAEPTMTLGDGLVETAHTFGQGLVGILTYPAQPTSATALVLFNAGLTLRSGPFRNYALLARHLARTGVTVFRFDQSGHGDSDIANGPAEFRKREEAELAMQLVRQRTGIERFVLGGICSGADDAFALAASDPRVAGILMMDGLAYRTTGYWLRHGMRRLARPHRLVLGALSRLARKGGVQPGHDDFRDLPARDDASAALEALVRRDARVLMLYTGGASEYFNYRAQARACFGGVMGSPQVTLEYWPDCDHTFYLKRDRARLHSLVASWMRSQFIRAG